MATELASPAGLDEPTRQLTAALARGDEEAFRQFHEQYFERLLRYLFVVTRGDDEAARDALQETFLRVIRHVRTFESEAAFWSWLTVLARSAAQDGGRRRHRYWRALQRYALALTSAPAPAAATDNAERILQTLEDCLGLLDADDRDLVADKYFRGFSVRALAEKHGLTEKAVDSRLVRARAFLRKQIALRSNNENAK